MKRSPRAAILAASSIMLSAGLAQAGAGDSTILGSFGTFAVDSAAVHLIYSAVSYANPASSTTLKATDGSLTLSANLATDAGRPYSALVGMLVPLEPLWDLHDLREATSISFRIKANQPCYIQFAFGSPVYPYDNQGILQVYRVAVSTTWKTVTVQLAPVPDLAYLDWMDDPVTYPGGIDPVWATDSTDPNFDTDLNIAKSVKNLMFSVDPIMGPGGLSVVKPVGILDVSIDDIVLHGVDLIDPPVIDPPTGHPGHGHHGHKPKPSHDDHGCHDKSPKGGKH